MVGALDSVAQDSNSRLDVEVSRYPPVPHFVHLQQKKETLDEPVGFPWKPSQKIFHRHVLGKPGLQVNRRKTSSGERPDWFGGGTNLQDPDQMGCTGQWLNLQRTSRTKRRERKEPSTPDPESAPHNKPAGRLGNGLRLVPDRISLVSSKGFRLVSLGWFTAVSNQLKACRCGV